MLRGLIAGNAALHRTALSRQICELWNWRNPGGRLKDIAARSLLRKLDERGLITLPARLTHKLSRQPKAGRAPRVPAVQPRLWAEALPDPIDGPLAQLRPLRIERADTPEHRGQAFAALRAHHYLGFSRSVGENVGYLVFDKPPAGGPTRSPNLGQPLGLAPWPLGSSVGWGGARLPGLWVSSIRSKSTGVPTTGSSPAVPGEGRICSIR